jgi:release factor glutamine methyltransferase
VLIPRSDTETLVERALEHLKDKTGPVRVLDLCAGSGCIGLAVAHQYPNATVVLADWSEDALRVCRQNIRRCGMSGQVSSARVNALEAPPALLSEFDLILSNPPYIPTADLAGLDASVRDYEPHMALDGGEDGLDFYRAIASKWKNALNDGGTLIFEIGYDQAPQVEYILAANGYGEIQTFKDPGDHWRVVEGNVT